MVQPHIPMMSEAERQAHQLSQELPKLPPEAARTPVGELLAGGFRQLGKLLAREYGLGEPVGQLLSDANFAGRLESWVGTAAATHFIHHLRHELFAPRNWPASSDALLDWAERHGVAHLMLREVRSVVQSHFAGYGSPAALPDIFDGDFWAAENAAARNGLPPATECRRTVWAWLQRQAGAVERAKRQPVEPRPPPPGLGARLHGLREAMRGRWPQVPVATETAMRVDVNKGTASFFFPEEVNPETRDSRSPTVTVELREAAEPSCTCSVPACHHRAWALDLTLEHLFASGYQAEQLLQASASAWHKVLTLVTPEGPRGSEVLSGFRLKLRGPVELEPRVEFTDGGKPRHRAAKPSELLTQESLSAQERRAVELLSKAESSYRHDGAEVGEALWELRGYPRLFFKRQGSRDLPVRAVAGEVALAFEATAHGLTPVWRLGEQRLTSLDEVASAPAYGGQVLVVPGADEVRLYRVPSRAWLFEDGCRLYGRSFPPESYAGLLASLSSIEGLTLELPEVLKGKREPARTRPSARVVLEAGPSLKLTLYTQPLDGGPRCVPGAGAAEVGAWREAGRVYTQRDLSAEREEAARVAWALQLPELSGWTWTASEPSEALELAGRLLEQAKAGLLLECPQGMLEVSRPAVTKDVRVSARAAGDWFQVGGEARLDGMSVPLPAVLEAIRGGKKWVQLSERKFARLSEELARALAPVALSGAEGDTGQLSLGQLASLAELESQLGELDAGAQVGKLLARMRGAKETAVKVPRGFKGELRGYQREGFGWLTRLASWAPGAVLADDMGLGKTVQALALLLARAKQGPALVVAPTSVAGNWVAEARRFAPGLKLRLLHEADRGEVIARAGPGEVLVASWSLLVREVERLKAREFATVVLDEAQALKNASTQRAQAARELKADFVVALTGTPLENHLGELWSLFRVTVPGLLASQEAFRARWAGPIEKTDDAVAWASLRGLVRPFLLRRAKGEVARELPQKTEVTLKVAPAAVEAGVYQAAREEALESLAGLVEERGDKVRFHVLAALTRLRQLACHVGLVDPDWRQGSSKLARLVELVGELKEEKHQVLVFSQFTSLLALARKALDEAGVKWLSLEGDTPLAERQARVEAFQRGEADAFLISLKAGGTGLNLTAADYVIHLDPWWNPAVEDQASDRAHRIGQTRPVTVYRLVTEGTVEEKILELHGKKRRLVEQVLEGAGKAGKMSTKELVELVRAGL